MHNISNADLKTVREYLIKHFLNKNFSYADLPTLLDRDIQDGVFIEDEKIYKTQNKSIRYDLTLPLFIAYKDQKVNKGTKLFSTGTVFRVEKEDESHYCEFNQFEIDIVEPESVSDDVEIGKQMKEITSKFFGNTVELRINYRPLTEWLMKLSVASNRQDFYNKLDELDKELSADKCNELFGENAKTAKSVLECSTVEELEQVKEVPKDIINYFRSYVALDDSVVIRPLLARGALYYDGIVYEMFYPGLNSAIMGGGRGSMFGVRRVGASFGLERLILCLSKSQCENC